MLKPLSPNKANLMETSRRRLFWMLKKWSSYSVWEYHARLMDIFVAHYEEAVNTWPSDEAPPAENLHAAYIAQAAFGKGLAMLRRGQRNVWLAREDGYLLEAANAVSKATAAITSREINKYDGGEQGLPSYAEWTDRLEALRVLKERTKVYGVKLIAQPTADYADRKPTAWIDTVEVDITAWLQRNAGDFGSVKPGGEESPVSPPILIASGEPIPKDGIWELVHPDFPPYTTEALNYFVSGISAPWCSAPDIGPTIVRAAMWRLVWEDTRYLDGVIPDESEYLADYSPAPEISAEEPVQVATASRVEANQPCPTDGYWYTPAKEHSRALFKRGDVMPDYPDSSYGATIWYWDRDQVTE